MLIVDHRERDIIPKLAKVAVINKLEYGDFVLLGNGPQNSKITIGIERKKVRDLIGCIVSGRLAERQIPGMLEMYDKVFVLIEGEWKDTRQGLQTLKKGSWKRADYSRRNITSVALEVFLTSLQLRMGVGIINTKGIHDTVALIVALNKWVEKEWETHRVGCSKVQNTALSNFGGRPSLFKRIALELPGISVKRYKNVEAAFGTVREMIAAPYEAWLGIPGIGPTTAKAIINAINYKLS